MADQDETLTRDLGTVNQTSPGITQFETPSAHGGMEEAEEQRPAFSPVAQPGMNEEIWWHTVESDRQARTQARKPTRGMIGRFHQPTRETIIVDGRHRGRQAG